MARLIPVLLLAVFTTPSTALAQARSLEQLAKKAGVPLKLLENTGAQKLLSQEVYQRRGYLKDIATKPRAALLPLVCYLAKGGDPDWPVQLTAVKVLSVFGLLGDRSAVVKHALPLLEGNATRGKGQLLRYTIEELNRLNRWFRMDVRLAPLLERHFRSKDFNMRGFAFRGITDLQHPRLVKELVLPAAWEIYKSKKVSVFDRRHAVRVFGRHEVREAIPYLQRNLRKDGTVAVISAWALGRMLDRSSLKELRKINKTAVHRLRMACFLARAKLNDKKCLKQALRTASDRREHDEIKRRFVADLGAMTQHTKKLKKLLKHLGRHRNAAVRVGAALALTRLGDRSQVKLLIDTLHGAWPDDPKLRRRGKGWKRQFNFMESLLRIEHSAADDAIVAIIDVKGKQEDLTQDGKDVYASWYRKGLKRSAKLKDWYAEYRAAAVLLTGERKITSALSRLTRLSKASWDHLKFHALVSRIELGDEKALKFLRWFLPKYDDRYYRDVNAIMGKTTVRTKRLKWSSIFDVCDKFERVGDADLYLPLLEELLQTKDKKHDPLKKGWARKLGGVERKGLKSKERTKGPKQEPPLFRPPEVTYRVRNQFARRRIVECAAKLGGEKAAPQLARALRDSRATVRSAALTHIGRISKEFTLHPGSGLQAEIKVWPLAVAWLKKRGHWPE